MSLKEEMLSRFSGHGSGPPLYVPDMTLWYNGQRRMGSLPDPWQGMTLSQVARAMGVPIWSTFRPWRIETPGVEVQTTEQGKERITRIGTSAGTLTARWTIGPDGDWWQTEHLVKTAQDLDAALEWAQARTYVLDAAGLAQAQQEVGEDGLLAIEIPRRPYSDVLHDVLGWGDGLMLLGEPAVPEIIAAIEVELQSLVQEVASLPGQVLFSLDNLDGQFISPRAFQAHMADSYRQSAEALHGHGKRLLVHVGGPIRHLLAPLAACGIDGLEGIAGPPQSDASLTEARALAGPEMLLWGGIPQDYVLETHDLQTFQAAVTQVARDVRGDERIVLGVVDRVPVEADLSRLKAIPALIEQA